MKMFEGECKSMQFQRVLSAVLATLRLAAEEQRERMLSPSKN
jgi:hypothetical protein